MKSFIIAGLALGLAACAPNAPAATSAPQPISTSAPAPRVATQPSATQPAPTIAAQLPASPVACTPSAAVTPEQTEGPYFKAGSPERSSLIQDGMKGIKLVLTGYVLTPDCKPVARVLLDFWQADSAGNYDNSGYTLRGHQFTDANGRYQLTTLIPGLYPGRTEHIHFKVQPPNGRIVTSQLYFPGVASNQRDGIFDNKLLMAIQDASDGSKTGTFNFVVK